MESTATPATCPSRCVAAAAGQPAIVRASVRRRVGRLWREGETGAPASASPTRRIAFVIVPIAVAADEYHIVAVHGIDQRTRPISGQLRSAAGTDSGRRTRTVPPPATRWSRSGIRPLRAAFHRRGTRDPPRANRPKAKGARADTRRIRRRESAAPRSRARPRDRRRPRPPGREPGSSRGAPSSSIRRP